MLAPDDVGDLSSGAERVISFQEVSFASSPVRCGHLPPPSFVHFARSDKGEKWPDNEMSRWSRREHQRLSEATPSSDVDDGEKWKADGAHRLIPSSFITPFQVQMTTWT